ncbi:ABC transporter substrate binding protein [Parendozoicomonas sp. Alg238-R29]|uniref:ABC transporter substrate binding protein n=1 Tax=Parendozoicomonas sp. Alg238-R29 TaxID=2993446 RepID=UPI00248E008E|nr:ABC transporter substrate binding protein [Parendozoicomonas sp. Alg238-R29]
MVQHLQTNLCHCIRLLSVCVLISIAEPGYSQLPVFPYWFGVKDDITSWSLNFAEQGKTSPTSEKQILFIYSKTSQAYDQAFVTIGRSFQKHRIDASYTLVNNRTAPELTEQLMMDDKFDLIFIAGSSATAKLYKKYPQLQTPVVTVTAKDPVILGLIDSYQPTVDSYAFTSLDIQASSLLSYLQTLNPQLAAIGILYGENNNSALKTQVQPLVAAAESAGIDVKTLAISQVRTEDSIQQKLPDVVKQFRNRSKHKGNSLLWITGSTVLFQHLDLIDDLAGNTPVITAVPDLVSSKPFSPMLAIGTSFTSNAALAALYARQILNGSVTPDQLPVGELSPPDIAINFQKVQESGWKVPVRMFELATILFNNNGQLVQQRSVSTTKGNAG